MMRRFALLMLSVLFLITIVSSAKAESRLFVATGLFKINDTVRDQRLHNTLYGFTIGGTTTASISIPGIGETSYVRYSCSLLNSGQYLGGNFSLGVGVTARLMIVNQLYIEFWHTVSYLALWEKQNSNFHGFWRYAPMFGFRFGKIFIESAIYAPSHISYSIQLGFKTKI